jgi:radical SAM superfamily enzyme YgiQ (UPF0313 family)
MYQDKRFRVRGIEDLRREIAWARDHVGDVRKVFLADGDALIAKTSTTLAVLEELRAAFPNLRRVSVYASPQSLQVRTVDEMVRLREAGLTQYYLGIESGDDGVLLDMKKGVDAEEMIRVALKAHEAGVKLSTMILLGAAGRERSERHALNSARVVNAIQPRFVSTLVLTPVPGTPIGDMADRGEFEDMDPIELAHELRAFMGALELKATVFRSNHASNYLTVRGNLPTDKEAMLASLDGVLAHPENARFVPKWMRGL